MLKSLNTESNTYLTPSLIILSVDNFLFPKISKKIEPKHHLLWVSPPPAHRLQPPRSRHARSPPSIPLLALSGLR